jgi:hypothetical protein
MKTPDPFSPARAADRAIIGVTARKLIAIHQNEKVPSRRLPILKRLERFERLEAVFPITYH